MQQRSVLGMIILTFVTFGLYQLYWVVVTNRALRNSGFDGRPGQSYIVVIILSFITFGLYGIYYNWRFCKAAEQQLNGMSAIGYFLLSWFGLSSFFIQADANAR